MNKKWFAVSVKTDLSEYLNMLESTVGDALHIHSIVYETQASTLVVYYIERSHLEEAKAIVRKNKKS